jgi:peptide/nickel transport system substrate-binding protein
MKKLLLVFILLLSSFILFAGGGQDTEESVLRVGLRKLTTIDPALGANDPEVMFNRLQYDYLIDILPNGDLVRALAESWSVSSDGLEYRIMLRDDVVFESGKALNSEDVVFTFNRLVEKGSSIVGLMGQKQVGTAGDGSAILEPTWTVEAEDAKTVLFRLETPNADFVYGLSSRFALILEDGSSDVNIIDDGTDPYLNFNGTGPFILVEYRPDERAVFEKNPNHWKADTVEIDRVELLFFDDDQSQLDALAGGALDFIIKIPDDLADSAESFSGITLVSKSTNTHPVIRLLTDEGSLGEDVRIRQAFKFATDRDLINLDVLDGRAVVGNNDPIGPVYGPLYNPQTPRPFDPDRAKALIAEVYADGAGNGFIVEVGGEPRIQVPFYVGDTFEYGLVAEFLQQQWAEAGIDVELFVVPENVYYADNENNWLNTQLGMTAWGTRPTPQEYLSVAYTTGAPFNEARWSNAEMDRLAALAAQTADIAERAAIYKEIAELFFEEGPILIPYFRPVLAAYSDRVTGLDVHPFPGRTDLSTVKIK